MSLGKKFAEHAPSRPGGWCHTCTVLKQMKPEDREALEHALADRVKFSVKAISQILADEGWYVGSTSLDRHRRGGCKGD